MVITTIANQKGGVGKTTTTINLSAGVANKGKKVLLIDIDPQANTTSGLGVDAKEANSISEALTEGVPIEDCIVSTKYKNLDLIPANMDLSGVEIVLAGEDDQITRLRNLLTPLKESGKYDYCFIDTPPSLGILMTSALTVADDILIPLQCEWFGLEGLAKIIEVIYEIKESEINPTLEVGGILLTMFDTRTNLSKSVAEEVEKYFPKEVYQTKIPRSVRISESPSYALTIFEHDPGGVGAKAYREARDEYLKRHGK